MARQGMIEYRKAFSMPPKFFATNDALYFFFSFRTSLSMCLHFFVIAVRKIDKPQSIFFTGILFKNQGVLQSLGVV